GGPVFYLRPAKINSAGLRRLRGGVLCTLVIGSASAQKQIHILNCQARLKRQVDPVPAVPHGMDIPRGPRILSAPGENQFRRAAPLAR
ncbi:hypothetical protein NE579_17205, partial [Intestinimonas massiliensis]